MKQRYVWKTLPERLLSLLVLILLGILLCREGRSLMPLVLSVVLAAGLLALPLAALRPLYKEENLPAAMGKTELFLLTFLRGMASGFLLLFVVRFFLSHVLSIPEAHFIPEKASFFGEVLRLTALLPFLLLPRVPGKGGKTQGFLVIFLPGLLTELLWKRPSGLSLLFGAALVSALLFLVFSFTALVHDMKGCMRRNMERGVEDPSGGTVEKEEEVKLPAMRPFSILGYMAILSSFLFLILQGITGVWR